jgi:hypothetical protein
MSSIRTEISSSYELPSPFRLSISMGILIATVDFKLLRASITIQTEIWGAGNQGRIVDFKLPRAAITIQTLDWATIDDVVELFQAPTRGVQLTHLEKSGISPILDRSAFP